MELKKELEPNWEKIVKAANVDAVRIGTSLQDYLHNSIRPLLPNGVGYFFSFNSSPNTQHIFYEILNPENKFIIDN